MFRRELFARSTAAEGIKKRRTKAAGTADDFFRPAEAHRPLRMREISVGVRGGDAPPPAASAGAKITLEPLAKSD